MTKDTISGYFRDLIERGFITMTQGGHLGPAGIGLATKWALQEETLDGKAPEKGFMAWREKHEPVQKIGTPRPKKQDAA